jgi:hypothetical protein
MPAASQRVLLQQLVAHDVFLAVATALANPR